MAKRVRVDMDFFLENFGNVFLTNKNNEYLISEDHKITAEFSDHPNIAMAGSIYNLLARDYVSSMYLQTKTMDGEDITYFYTNDESNGFLISSVDGRQV